MDRIGFHFYDKLWRVLLENYVYSLQDCVLDMYKLVQPSESVWIKKIIFL